MYMSMQYTGQVINIELPLGLATAIYILDCGFVVWKKNRKENEQANSETHEYRRARRRKEDYSLWEKHYLLWLQAFLWGL